MAKNNLLSSVEVGLRTGKLSHDELRKLLEETKPEAAKEPLKTFHTYEEMKNAPPVRFAIKDFLQCDGCTIFAGLSGHAKTWTTLATIKATLTGEPLFDYFPVMEQAERVIYLGPEVTMSQVFFRLCTKFKLDDYIKSGRLLISSMSIGRKITLRDQTILDSCKGADIHLDTLPRFRPPGQAEDSVEGNQELVDMIFNLLQQGARLVNALQHSKKSFEEMRIMTLENIVRGSGDIGAMASTVWGHRRLTAADDPTRNLVYMQNVKPRDFTPPEAFILRLRPDIDERGLIGMCEGKSPGECFSMQKEIEAQSGVAGGKSTKVLAKEIFELDKNISRRGLIARLKSDHGKGARDETVGTWLKEFKGSQSDMRENEDFDAPVVKKEVTQ